MTDEACTTTFAMLDQLIEGTSIFNEQVINPSERSSMAGTSFERASTFVLVL